MILIKRPAVTILIGAIIGIIYGLYLKIGMALTVTLLGLLLFLIQKDKKKLICFLYKRRKIILMFFISTIISILYTISVNNKYEKFYNKIPENIRTIATVVGEAKETEYYYSYEIKINQKRFIMYVKKNNPEKLKYGMEIILEGKYIEPTEDRNYKGFNYKEYLKTKKIYGSFKAEKISVIKENNVNFILRISNNTRNKVIEIAKKILPKETSSLLIGILIGERQYISEDITENFSKSSLSHILAISGSHISYIIIGITFILTKSRTSKKGMYIITILSLIFFIFITNFSSSVIRACIMGIIVLFAKIVYRKPDILTSISVSLLIILIDNPFAIKDIGLQLSYLGTIGIVYLNKPIVNFLEKYMKKKIAKMLAITISAQIMVLPVTVINFNNISTVFIISNIIAAPLTGGIILLGYANVLIGVISLDIAKVIAIITHSLVQLLIWTAEFTAKIPYSSITTITPHLITVIYYYIFIYAIWRKKLVKKASIIFLILIICITSIDIIPKKFKIHFIDVGQRRLYINTNTQWKKYSNRYRGTR